jgi:hypothetical protein
MLSVSAANVAIIERLEDEPSQLPEVMEFGMTIRFLALSSRNALESLGGLSTSMQENARTSRVLRPPTRRVVTAIDRWAAATQLADEWDRRLQALGVPLPSSDFMIEHVNQDPAELGNPIDPE